MSCGGRAASVRASSSSVRSCDCSRRAWIRRPSSTAPARALQTGPAAPGRSGSYVTRTLPGAHHWLLDEVTAVPGWSQTIKELRDQDTNLRRGLRRPDGSSARDLEQARRTWPTAVGAHRFRPAAAADGLPLVLSGAGRFRGAAAPGHPPEGPADPEAELAIGLEPWSNALADAWELFLDVGGFPARSRRAVGDGAVSEGFIQGLWDVVLGDAIRATPMSEADVTALLDRLTRTCVARSTLRASPGTWVSRTSVGDLSRIEDLIRAFLASALLSYSRR